MLITSYRVAGAPSRRTAEVPSCRVAPAASLRLAGFGPGAVARERGLAGHSARAGYQAGSWRGDSAAGYLPGLEGSFQLGQIAIQASGDTKRTVQIGTVKISTVQNSTDHNTMTRLVPAFRGGVGPHPPREPWPA